jgi:signal transduction histidine kinase
LLDISKLEGGRLQFHEDYFDFDEVVDEIIEQVQRTTDAHTIIKKGVTTKKVFGDKERVGQVITNLLTNAIKYSPGTQEIQVISSFKNGSIQLAVKDYGMGIPPDKISHVFERFYRVSSEAHDTVPGMGIGLYISAEIIKRQKGKIWVESRPGKGSTFYFSLPIPEKKKTIKKGGKNES